MIDPRRDIETVETAAQKASAISTLLCNDIPCPVTTEYQDYAISTALSSADQLFKDLDAEQRDSISHSYTLTGNVEPTDVSAYEAQNPNYTFKVVDPYGSKSTDPFVRWGAYFSDMLTEIDSDVKRRNGNVITLDFAGLMMIIASLSSMITLTPSDLSIIPADQATYIGYTGKSNEVSKKDGLLKQDPVLFHWFVVQYILSADPSKEVVARALYSALRCGLVHSLTVGHVFGSRRGGFVIALGSGNPDSSSNDWYVSDGSGSNRFVFYFKEMYALIDGLIQKLFSTCSTDATVARFQSDARLILNGYVPVMLLKAEPKK